MEEKFDYTLVPNQYAHCFNAACPRAGECLRQLVGRYTPSGRLQVCTFNPQAYPAEGADCPMFQPVKVVKIAWGLRRAILRMTYEDGTRMKKWLNRYYPRMTLSRVMNHKRGISPAEQEAIVAAFRSFGMTDEDVFDQVTYTYDWDYR